MIVFFLQRGREKEIIEKSAITPLFQNLIVPFFSITQENQTK
jgi:hypothetical protein